MTIDSRIADAIGMALGAGCTVHAVVLCHFDIHLLEQRREFLQIAGTIDETGRLFRGAPISTCASGMTSRSWLVASTPYEDGIRLEAF